MNKAVEYRLFFVLLLLVFSALSVFAQTPSAPISYTGKSDFTIDGKTFTAGVSGASIFLTNCSNVKITNCKFLVNKNIIGVQLNGCKNVEVVDCYFESFRSGVYAYKCTGGINIHCNSFKDVAGGVPRGQMVQFNTCNGAGNRVNYNVLDHTFGSGAPEDLVNMYGSSGTSADPIQIIGNKLRGGGPSTSGGGIIVGDNNGHDFRIEDNILVDCGQYGIGVPAGYNVVVKNNKIYAKSQAWTNVGIYVGVQSEVSAGFECKGSTVSVINNQVKFYNKKGVLNGFYNCPCCPGVSLSGNNFNANIDASILPAKLIIDATKCSVSSPVNTAPSVSLTAPLAGTSFIAPAAISISATASDSDGSIAKVDFYNGSTLLYTDATAPYAYSWPGVAAGSYSITAKAYDNKGAFSTSAAVSVTVKTASANASPVVSLIAPSAGASYTAPASITLSAKASDADGMISKVEFYSGTTLLNSNTSAPYAYTWTGVAAGTYSITAKAYDNRGAVATTAAVSVKVSAPVTVTTGIISGPACTSTGTSTKYTVLPEYSGVTQVNWWSNSGAAIVVNPTNSKEAKFTFPSAASAVTINAGVNFSGAPYYKEYKISVKVGACSSFKTDVSASVFNSNTTLKSTEGQIINTVEIYDINGQLVATYSNVNASEVEVGDDLSQGIYLLKAISGGEVHTNKVMKQ
ncbi:MAG: Ig-like domain-containing protein [Flavobacteriales bacterium]